MNALEVDGICKSFGGFQVLKNISFSVQPAERIAIIGPNGAGKTTLFNIISGRIKPDTGHIYLNEKDITQLSLYRRSLMGLARTFQRTNLFFNLSLRDNINLALLMNKLRLNPDEFLKDWGLWEKRKCKVGRLSYGEQRQVEILLALAQSPQIILLDEPTAGMSPVETNNLIQMINTLPRDLTLLIIEHDMEVVFNIADRIMALHLGQVICDGDKNKVKSDPKLKEVYFGVPDKEVLG
jgi:branched-chain amino acid transport system ATP-binding protein